MSADRGIEARLYRFGPRDRRGLVAGLRTGQVLVGAGALLCALGLLRSLGGAPGALGAFAALVAGAGMACWPVAGRTLEEWLPLALRFGVAARAGTRRTADRRTARGGSPAWQRVPRPFSDLEVVALGSASGTVGVVHDRRRRTCTGVYAISGGDFALAGGAERARRVGAWSAALASLATGADAPHRLAWIERILPDRGEHLARPDASHAPGLHYATFVEDESSTGWHHELFLACSVPGPPPAEDLFATLRTVEQRCGEAGLALEGPLSATGVANLLRRGLDVVPRDRVATRPWPLAVRETWSHVEVDGLLHATYWIAEWPRTDVRDDFLLPMLLGPGAAMRRSVVVVLEPRDARSALRAAEHARTATVADAELRRRHGFALTARARREHEAVERREQELATGHAGYRFSGYVTVSSPDAAGLAAHCARIEQAGALAHLDLRRLYGLQAESLLYGLPAGRGRG